MFSEFFFKNQMAIVKTFSVGQFLIQNFGGCWSLIANGLPLQRCNGKILISDILSPPPIGHFGHMKTIHHFTMNRQFFKILLDLVHTRY